MRKPLHVLILEDLEADAELLLLELQRGHYELVYRRVETSDAFREAIAQETWDVILADYRLPGFSAIDALKIIQSYNLDVPFIIVSGSIGEEIAVAAMKAGVHDYLMKDNLARLLPAIDRELREAEIRAERRQINEALQYQAFYDNLTGLPNRNHFLSLLQRRIQATSSPFAVLYLDIDRYQTIKYSLGHTLGEQLLVAIARRLETYLSPQDVMARVSTNEFALLLYDAPNLAQVEAISRELQQALSRPFVIGDHCLLTTGSIGIALSDIGTQQAEEILRAADTAKHCARQQGGGGWAVFDQKMQTQALERLDLEFSLQQAIKFHQLSVQYQPIVRLRDAELIGFEALARWQHSQRGAIPPSTFIPIAEEMGLISALGQWVLQEACQRLQTWKHQFPQYRHLAMSVNLSVKQLIQPGLFEQIEQVLTASATDSIALRLEITETALMENAAAAKTLLEQLKTLPIQIGIDDFGTGYSSLSYLTTLPIDLLKIDRSFVNGLENDQKHRDVVKAIIALAHTLGLASVAEGIETAEQWRLLYEMGCEYGQGYFFSRPADPDRVIEMLQRGWLAATGLPEAPTSCQLPGA